eukprot:Gregarina_sp_Pseudo_9__633@NODE_1402_length_1630_cov_571_390949_g1304_i0_p1_GENE_NODE_1402_length_1630_cov_571_390949_g1304_i0NODE_1402_length_1630_cov_571_390949_g1304_i0_p1_ORF_typecomplete_len478_score115_15Integrin_beta/PF00362_18/1_4e23VWA/PF00092_28/3_9e06VWA/PF00092_28/8_3e03_NODE_1402_length_1630_cov_571_390949_g1304_i0521434
MNSSLVKLSVACAFVYCAGDCSPEDRCFLPLDVVFVQDTTGSFDEDLPNVVHQIPAMVEAITSQHPYSNFGVVEFRDKPFVPLGTHEDFCYKLAGSLSGEIDEFRAAYASLIASGGSDVPEATYHALIASVEDPALNWRPLAHNHTREASAAEAGARVVILSTDAVPHLPNDYLNMYDHSAYPELPDFLPPFSGSTRNAGRSETETETDWQCAEQDYPAPDQVKTAFAANDAYLVILTPEDDTIVPAWTWVNSGLFGNPPEFYQFIAADSSNLLDGVLNALEAVTSTACGCRTTTAAPTTATTPSITTPGRFTSANTPAATLEPSTPEPTASTAEPTPSSASTTRVFPTVTPAQTGIQHTSAPTTSVASVSTTRTALSTGRTPGLPGATDTAAESGATHTVTHTATHTQVGTTTRANTATHASSTTQAAKDTKEEAAGCCPQVEIIFGEKPQELKLEVKN